jgi:uncharacterized protein (DUF433 family)
MANDLIDDRGRGPELVGTRITVYNLLPHFLDASTTEASICRMYDLTPEEVAAARAYVLNNPDAVLARHLDIEARMAAGNPPEVIERAKQTHATFLRFQDWLAQRRQIEAQKDAEESPSACGEKGRERLPTFQEWLTQQESMSEKGT